MKQKMNRDKPPRMAGKQERLKADRAEKFSAVWRDNLFSKRRNSPDGSNFAFVRNLQTMAQEGETATLLRMLGNERSAVKAEG